MCDVPSKHDVVVVRQEAVERVARRRHDRAREWPTGLRPRADPGQVAQLTDTTRVREPPTRNRDRAALSYSTQPHMGVAQSRPCAASACTRTCILRTPQRTAHE